MELPFQRVKLNCPFDVQSKYQEYKLSDSEGAQLKYLEGEILPERKAPFSIVFFYIHQSKPKK